MWRAHVRGLLGLMLVAGAGCGGGAGQAGGSTTAVDEETGKKIVTVGGKNVTEEAHDRWNEATELFKEYEDKGWNDSRCEEAVAAFEQADEAQSGRLGEALYMAGLARARCGNEEGALSYYKQALDASPKLCEARTAVGVDHLENERVQQAEQFFQRAVQDSPKTCARGYVNLAIVQREQGKSIDEARRNLRRALAIDSDYLPAFNELGLLFLHQAREQGEEQKLDLAEIVLRHAQMLQAEYAPIYNTWGLVKMERGDIIQALDYFKKARDLDNKMFEAHMNFGQVTLSFRGYQDAKQAFSRAVELKPKHYEATLGLGAALRGLEKTGEAEELYNKAKGLDSDRPEAFFNLGILYMDYKQGSMEDMEQAKSYLNKFLAKAKGTGEYEEKVENVKRECRMDDQDRPVGDCRPGRLQRIEQIVKALREMEKMKKMQEKMKKERQQQQQQGGGDSKGSGGDGSGGQGSGSGGGGN